MKKYLRFLFGLRRFLKERIDAEKALQVAWEIISERIRRREENFLNLARKGIFEYPKSPYLSLLKARKIDFDRIRKSIEWEGLEKTLEWLKEEGIFFTVEEYKGKTPVSRNGIKLWLKEKDFDNPFLSTAYEVRSGATRSAGTRIRIDFDYLVQRSYYDALLLKIHNALNSPVASWFPVFPGAPGINSSLRFARIGNPPQKWFSQVDGQNLRVNWEKRWGTKYIIYMSKLLGVSLPEPEFVDLNNACTVARWASDVLKEYPNCVIYTFASSAVRVCIAARENNLNIRNAIFLVTGEPLTPHKKKEILSTGAKVVPVYGISEAGVVAAGCNKEFEESDHCHIYHDTTAVISYKRKVSYTDATVDSLLFTSILYESPKILLNVEMGDYGDLGDSSCECSFGQIGFTRHLASIRSFEKLTGEGVTFVNTDFIRLIEEVLPRRFGGRSTDYQLVEYENSNGLSHLDILVSPQIGPVDERAVIDTFITTLRNSENSPESWAQSGSEMWAQANIIKVRRKNPIPTKRGKILPFHIKNK